MRPVWPGGTLSLAPCVTFDLRAFFPSDFLLIFN